MPPETVIKGHPKVLGREAIGDGPSGDGEGSGGEDPGSCDEDDLHLSGVEDEAAGRAPGHKAVDGTLYLVEEDCRVRSAAEDRSVIGKRNTEGRAVINKLDSFIEGKEPEGCRAYPPLGEPHARGTGRFVEAVVVGHIAVKKVVVIPTDHPRVRPNTTEAIPDMARGNGVEGASDIQKRSKAVLSLIHI